GGDELDLLAHAFDERAGSDELVAALSQCGVTLQHLRHLPLVTRGRLEGIDATSGAECSSGECTQHFEKLVVEIVEGARCERIRGENPDHSASFYQRAAEASVH